MKHSITFLFLFVLFDYGDADALQQMFRNVLLSVKEMGEKVLSNVNVPSPASISLQLDPGASQTVLSIAQIANACPSFLPWPSLVGSWLITRSSKRWMQTSFADVDQLIDTLSTTGSVQIQRNWADIIKSPPDVVCPMLTFSADQTSFEWIYRTSFGGNKSIIGKVEQGMDRSMRLLFGGDVEMNVTATYTSPLGDIVVIADRLAIPQCDNVMVLRRLGAVEGRVSEMLHWQGLDQQSNPLVDLGCDRMFPPVQLNSTLSPNQTLITG